MRLVLDTNIWLSGLMLPESIPGQILRAVRTARLVAVMSAPLSAEIALALTYRKVRTRIALSDEELARFVAELQYITDFVTITGSTAKVPRDRRDDIVLATFVAGSADYLITGDADLLELADRYPILTARAFHDQFLR